MTLIRIQANYNSIFFIPKSVEDSLKLNDKLPVRLSGKKIIQKREINPLLFDTLKNQLILPDLSDHINASGYLIPEIPIEIAEAYPDILFFFIRISAVGVQGQKDLYGYKDGEIFDVRHTFNCLSIHRNNNQEVEFEDRLLLFFSMSNHLESQIEIISIDEASFSPYNNHIIYNFKIVSIINNIEEIFYIAYYNDQIEAISIDNKMYVQGAIKFDCKNDNLQLFEDYFSKSIFR